MAEYAVALCRASRSAGGVRLGASPRAAIWLIRSAQAHAVVSGRAFVTPDDVKAVAVACLAHRLLTDEGVGAGRRRRPRAARHHPRTPAVTRRAGARPGRARVASARPTARSRGRAAWGVLLGLGPRGPQQRGGLGPGHRRRPGRHAGRGSVAPAVVIARGRVGGARRSRRRHRRLARGALPSPPAPASACAPSTRPAPSPSWPRAGSWHRAPGRTRPAPSDGSVTLLPAHRGVHGTVALEIASAAPFGLLWWRRTVTVALPRRLHVRPRLGGPGPFPPDGTTPGGTAPNAPRAGGRTRGVRPYRPGDQRRWVHWPATAHAGELMVRDMEGPTTGPVSVEVRLPADPEAAERAADGPSARWWPSSTRARPWCCAPTRWTARASARWATGAAPGAAWPGPWRSPSREPARGRQAAPTGRGRPSTP